MQARPVVHEKPVNRMWKKHPCKLQVFHVKREELQDFRVNVCQSVLLGKMGGVFGRSSGVFGRSSGEFCDSPAGSLPNLRNMRSFAGNTMGHELLREHDEDDRELGCFGAF